VNVVDSSGWLSYLAEEPNADWFAPALEAVDQLVVPTVTITEVFKHLSREVSEHEALKVSAYMRNAQVVDLDANLAISAADFGLRHKLPLADSIIFATAQAWNATLWTQDSDFEGLAGVNYRPRS